MNSVIIYSLSCQETHLMFFTCVEHKRNYGLKARFAMSHDLHFGSYKAIIWLGKAYGNCFYSILCSGHHLLNIKKYRKWADWNVSSCLKPQSEIHGHQTAQGYERYDDMPNLSVRNYKWDLQDLHVCLPHKAIWQFYIKAVFVTSKPFWVKLRNSFFPQDSFQTLKNWVKELRQHGPPNIVVAIAGNKCDLSDARWIPPPWPRNTPHPVISVQIEGMHPPGLSTQFDVRKRLAYLLSAYPETKPRTQRYRARDSWKKSTRSAIYLSSYIASFFPQAQWYVLVRHCFLWQRWWAVSAVVFYISKP